MKFREFINEEVKVTSKVTNEHTKTLAEKLGKLKLNCEVCGYEDGYCLVYFPEIGDDIYIGEDLNWCQPVSSIDFKNIDAWLKILKALKKLS